MNRSCEGGESKACKLQSGEYYALPPADWDGTSPLDAVVHAHGWSNGATNMIRKNQKFTRMAHERGMLVVYPQGEGDAWSVTGGGGRDDLAYFDELVETLHTEWKVEQVFASGHSLGGSMIWDLACYRAGSFAAFSPSSGGFWEPMPTECTAEPFHLMHTHGLNDTTVPMAGRSLGSIAQGDIYEGFDVLLAHNRCTAPPATVKNGAVECQVYTCETGSELQLCTHEGLHKNPDGWEKRTLDFYAAHQ